MANSNWFSRPLFTAGGRIFDDEGSWNSFSDETKKFEEGDEDTEHQRAEIKVYNEGCLPLRG